MKLEASDIKKKAIKSVKWTALMEIVSRSIQPIVVLILARLLAPAEFGVVGVAMIVIGLARIFQDFGLGKTLIQRETEIDKSANIIFWTNLTLSLFLYFILFITAPLLSQFFHEPKVIDVIRVLCLQIIFFSLISVHQSLFQRKFQFKQLFLIRLFSAIVPGCVSIPLALSGYGVWSLVWGTLAGTAVQVLLFWRNSPWRPKLSFDFQLARQLLGFSSWVVLEAFLGWLIVWGDSIVLGHFLGVKELGVYRVGVTFLTLVFGIFFSPILPVVYSIFSRLQSNLSELKQFFLKITQLIAAISLPIGLGLAISAKSIALVIFGRMWLGIEIVILILAISESVAWLVAHNHEAYRAIGRPDINVKLLILSVICFLPAYILAAPHGLFVFCLVKSGVVMLTMFFHLFVANKVLHLPFTYLWKLIRIPLVAAIPMGFAIYGITNVINTYSWFSLISSIISGGIFYLLTLWMIKKDFVKWSFRQLMEMAR
ncbi:lipopolysaccharide biosynthesis protein [candidate division WOR-3 bacterium]|nr:lipopolysaccharide biosynthesis protein [candidate division WOR-3 bacterium]